MKKSNQPERARKLRSNWGRVFSTGRPKDCDEAAQYREITLKALMLYRDKGRARAIEYLTWNRDWLSYYIGFGALPSSGALLDRLIREEGNQ
jgi:hypothetical protein